MGLAALHQRSLLGETNNHHLELEFHTKALNQLQEFVMSININEFRLENETLVEVVTCGIALISFEVLRGSATNWEPHFCAMTSIAITMHDQLQIVQSPNHFRSPLFESRATAAMAFHIPVLLWMDLLACVATREKPKFPYNEWLGSDCTFQLADIMGCHNSVMKAIGDLATLTQWIVGSRITDESYHEEFQQRRQQVENELEAIIDITPVASTNIRESMSELSTSKTSQGQRPDQDCVTRIFATAALAQLAVVSARVPGNFSSTRTRWAVSRIIMEIKLAHQIVSPRKLSWAICVAGCLADQDQQQFFEALLNPIVSEGIGMIGNSGTVRDILRACWRNKIETPDQQWDCSSTMKHMGICALLI
ncbi:hypothetical protein FLONG3_1325 [Fusarium longipes]|uniref:Uncharacterized protein n=1 Tax=Fusarium longipes TaxID=694270 RepID=A0A395T822_9HYPO|nr:hypothetical protein FLONG3_1325 [Fusarium longipes]